MTPLLTVQHVRATEASLKIAAVVNNSAITEQDVNDRIRLMLLFMGEQSTPEAMQTFHYLALNTLIEEAVELAAAQKANIKVSDSEVAENIKMIEERNDMQAGDIFKTLGTAGVPKKVFENSIRAQLAWARYVQEYIVNDVTEVSEQEINLTLELAKERHNKPQIKLAEIVLNIDDPKEEATIKAQMENFIELLKSGRTKFTAIAQQFSQAPSRSNGGIKDWETCDELEPALRDIIFPNGQDIDAGVEANLLLGPLRTSSGFTLVYVIEKKNPTKNSATEAEITRDDIVYMLRQNMAAVRASELLRKLKNQAYYEVRS